MPAKPPPFDWHAARQVRADTLEPAQQTTSRKLKTACDYREKDMLKHPHRSAFHSWAEYLHAGLLEGDPNVTSYTPQPFRLRVNGRRYTPDCYVVSDEAPRRVQELKPRGEFPDEKRQPLAAFFAQHRMTFEVLSNEAIIERQVEAENWLAIVQILHLARDLDTTAAEDAVLTQLQAGPCTLGELIDPGDRERTYAQEIALFRLLHQGVVTAALTDKPLNYDTEFSLCP